MAVMQKLNGRRETNDEISAKCASVKNLTILFEADMQPYLKYVIDKYGKDFTQLYE